MLVKTMHDWCHRQTNDCWKQTDTPVVTAQRAKLQTRIEELHEPWGGVLCLDFANTVEPRGGPPPVDVPAGVVVRDELLTYGDLVAWAVHLKVMPIETGEALLVAAESWPEQAAAVLDRAHVLRETVYRIFWSVAHGEHPAATDLAVLAREYADGAAAADLVATEAGVAWTWPEDAANMARPLWPVAWSATNLLTEGDPARIKVCPGVSGQPLACAWLFYDATKNRGRRWCSMVDCGGATKSQRQTARRRATRSQ